MTAHFWWALLLVVLLEARALVRLRWDFGRQGAGLAWLLGLGLLFFNLLSARMSEEVGEALMLCFTRLPLWFAPLLLVHRYGMERGLPLSTFRYPFPLGPGEVERGKFYPGLPYLGLLVLTAGLGPRPVLWYGLGAAVLFSAGLYGVSRASWGKFLLAVGLSWLWGGLLAAGLYLAYYYLWDGGWYREMDRGSAQETSTYLGRVGEIKQSPKVHWRLKVEQGPTPLRLQTSTYSTFALNNWLVADLSSIRSSRLRSGEETGQGDASRSTARDFTALSVVPLHLPEEREEGLWRRFAFHPEDLDVSTWPSRLRLQGGMQDEGLLPLPNGVRRLREMACRSLEVNLMGTTRVVEPLFSVQEVVLEGEALGPSQRQADPVPEDLVVERARSRVETREELKWSLRRFWQEVGVVEGAREEGVFPNRSRSEQQALIQRLKQHLATQFHYSRHQKRPPEAFRHLSPVAYFLDESREGHCEYFATATVLLLREMGIPARYCLGYSVQEQVGDREWVLRGKHAHAWAQAYLGGRWVRERTERGEWTWRCRGGQWVEVDTTPGSWVMADQVERSLARQLLDAWQSLQQGFAIWRSRLLIGPMGQAGLWVGMGGMLLWLGWRLWGERRERLEGRGVRRPLTLSAAARELDELLSWLDRNRAGAAAEGPGKSQRGVVELLREQARRHPSLASRCEALARRYEEAAFRGGTPADPDRDRGLSHEARELVRRLEEEG